MKNFTIENESNNITIHVSAKEADAVPNSERFSNEAALAKLAVNWPASRLIEIWNSLPGETPVRKFKDRATAVSRIWKALQSLGQAAPAVEEPAPVPEVAPVPEQEASETAQPEAVIPESTGPAVAATAAPQSPDVAPEEPAANKKANRAKKAPVAEDKKDAGAPREGSKTAQVIATLKREGGTTLEEIMTAMGWLKHTTRAMLSAGGSLTKNHGLVVTSEKVGDKRVYFIKG
jgi:type IV secretory pathway VirB10-like protein